MHVFSAVEILCNAGYVVSVKDGCAGARKYSAATEYSP